MTSNSLRSGRNAASLTALLLTATGLVAFTKPTPPPDCKQAVLAAYHKLAGMQTAGEKAVFHLQFISNTQYAVPGQRIGRQSTTRGELYCQGRKGFYRTEEVSVWQDGHYVATVLHAQHTILLTRSAPNQFAGDPKRLLLVQDSLIHLGRVQHCGSEQVGTKSAQQHVQLTYNGAVASRLKLTSLDFWLTSQQVLQKVKIVYQPNSSVQQVTLSFPVQEWLASSSKLPVDARAQVIDANGRLLPAFHGYQLINQINISR